MDSSGARQRAPARLRHGEARAPVDQLERAGPPPPLVARRLGHVEGDGAEDDAVVLEGAARSDETSRDVLTHPVGIARERVAPAAAAAGLEADDVAPFEDESVTLRGQLALAGRAGVQQDASGAPGVTARHAPGGDEEVLHARGQLRPLAKHA